MNEVYSFLPHNLFTYLKTTRTKQKNRAQTKERKIKLFVRVVRLTLFDATNTIIQQTIIFKNYVKLNIKKLIFNLIEWVLYRREDYR
jgi:hypothetical protein